MSIIQSASQNLMFSYRYEEVTVATLELPIKKKRLRVRKESNETNEEPTRKKKNAEKSREKEKNVMNSGNDTTTTETTTCAAKVSPEIHPQFVKIVNSELVLASDIVRMEYEYLFFIFLSLPTLTVFFYVFILCGLIWETERNNKRKLQKGRRRKHLKRILMRGG